MKANKKIFSFLILSALTFLLAGCPIIQMPIETAPKPNPQENQNNDMSKRFQDVAPNRQTIVDSAIELSKKNTELFEKMTVMQQDNQELAAENQRLQEHVAILEPELKQAKKELKEANDLLIEMRIELNNWKTDILGYRDEMREAYTAQMEIMLKIAQAMGAEIMSEQPDSNQTTETLTSGEPNE